MILAVDAAKDALFLIRLLADPPEFTRTDDYTSIRRVIVHGVLAHAGLCSRVLFPGRGARDQWIAERVRERVGVNDESVLRDRALRDSFEHVDERIEAWSQQAQPGAQPLKYWYTPGATVRLSEKLQRNLFQAYLGDRIVSVGRDGSLDEVRIAELRDELERVVEAGTSENELG